MFAKVIIQIVIFIIGVLIDAYLIERYLLKLKKRYQKFELKPKYLLWGFNQKTHLSNISGLTLIPIIIQFTDPFIGEPLQYIPLIIGMIILLRLIGNSIQYLLFYLYSRSNKYYFIKADK